MKKKNNDTICDCKITSINWHISSVCNYDCKFCFVKNIPDEDVSEKDIIGYLTKIRDLGIKKINFVGGEPLLHPRIAFMIHTAKKNGLITSIVTNASLLDEKFLISVKDSLDWIGISIDSFDEKKEQYLGRGFGNHVDTVISASSLVKKYGIRLKINTVVTKLNYEEDMAYQISKLRPERWKVFQFLHLKGQNDDCFTEMAISSDEFDVFIDNNRKVKNYGIDAVFETDDDMVDSYLMMYPDGKIMRNTDGCYVTCGNILDFTKDDLSEIVNIEKYENRGARYFEEK